MIKYKRMLFSVLKKIKENLSISLCIKSTLLLWAFLAPTHWFWHWEPAWIYWGGWRMEAWIPRIFVSSILVWTLWLMTLLWAVKNKEHTKNRPLETPQFRLFDSQSQREVGVFLLLGIGIGLWTSLVSVLPLANLSVWFQMWSGPWLLAIWLFWQRDFFPQKWLLAGALSGICLQAVLAWGQIITQTSLGGYWLFGQPDFSSWGLALSQMSGPVRILPYGSTPHPNVLAGWIFLGSMIWWQRTKVPALRIIGVGFMLVTCLWTESWSALATYFLAGLVFVTRGSRKFHQVFTMTLLVGIPLLLVAVPFSQNSWLEQSSWDRRQVFLQSVPSLMLQRPQGWGFLQHQIGYPPETQARLGVLSRQPVHNAGISGLLDLGIGTILLIIIFFIFVQKKYSFKVPPIVLLTIFFSLDHWTYSTISGQNFLITYIIISSKYFSLNNPIENMLQRFFKEKIRRKIKALNSKYHRHFTKV